MPIVEIFCSFQPTYAACSFNNVFTLLVEKWEVIFPQIKNQVF